MRVAVICEQCGGGEVGSCETDDARVLELLLIAAHSSAHPAQHKLTVKIDGGSAPMGQHELLLRCLNEECRNEPRGVKVMTQPALYGVHAMCFHSHHEGHPIEVFLDGRQIVPVA